MNTGCLILAGGKSRRMGYRKSSLRLNGTTFLDKLIFELRDFLRFWFQSMMPPGIRKSLIQ